MPIINNKPTFTKDPDAKKDYAVDWTNRLDVDDSIVTSTWTVPTGITQEPETSGTTIWLSGGALGSRYLITNHVVTAQGREDDCSFYVKIENQ